MSPETESLRIERYQVDDGLIVALLNWGQRLGEGNVWRFPVLPEVPEGAKFVNAVWVPERRMWELHIVHPMFDEIPAGQVSPLHSQVVAWRVQTFDELMDGIGDDRICEYLQSRGYAVGVGK